MAATFPFSYMCTRFGVQYIFLVSGVISAMSTILIPPAASWGLNWLLLMRIFQGLAYACDFAVIGVICTRWASLAEISIFLSMLTLFPAYSNIFTSLLSGVLCDLPSGWPLVHYTHGVICLFFFIFWFVLYTDRPDNSRFVSEQELVLIHKDKNEAHRKITKKIPYLKICKNRVIWSVWLNAFSDLFIAFYFIIYGPTYNSKVLKLDYTTTGIAGALDTVAIVPLKLAAGYASDNCVTERQKMWIYNSLCTLIPALIFILVSLLPTNVPILTVALFGISSASVGFNSGGYYRCCCLVARQSAEFVIAFTQFIKCAVFFVAPLLVEMFVYDEANPQQWNIIFFIMAVASVVSNIIFCYYATDKPAKFTYDVDTKENEAIDRNSINKN